MVMDYLSFMATLSVLGESWICLSGQIWTRFEWSLVSGVWTEGAANENQRKTDFRGDYKQGRTGQDPLSDCRPHKPVD